MAIANLAAPVFKGNRFDMNGSVDFQGSSGTTVFYLDPQPSGTPLGPFALSPNGINFAAAGLSLGGGKWKVRVVITPLVGPAVTVESPDLTVNRVVGRAVMPLSGGVPTTTPPSTWVNVDQDLRPLYNAAINAAILGAKRLAAANALIAAFGNKQRLSITRNKVPIVRVEYTGAVTTTLDGSNVRRIHTSTQSQGIVLNAGDLSTGNWRFIFQGGDRYSKELHGTVGPIGSNADIVLSANPPADALFASNFSFIIPAIIDQA